MIDFIIQYWIEFLFSLLVAGGAYFGKRYLALSKEERKKEQESFHNMVKEEIANGYTQSQKDDIILQEQIEVLKDQLKVLKNGVLSIQGKNFKNECRELLVDGKVITLDEYEQICSEHEVYNGLGGNHKGDELFKLVQEKFKNTIM